MEGDHLGAVVGSHLGVPLLLLGVELGLEGGEAALVVGLAGGIELGEPGRDRARDDAAVLGIGPVVGVAVRMHVAHGARDLLRRPLQDLAADRGVEVAAAARLDLGVAALRHQRRQVARFELEPGHDHEVGARELQHERGLGVDEVRILVALGQREGLDAIAADRRGDRGEVLEAGDDLRAWLRRRRRSATASRIARAAEAGQREGRLVHGRYSSEGMRAVRADRELELEQ